MGWLTAVAARVEAAFEARCFRLGRDRGPVCQLCDEPMVAVLDLAVLDRLRELGVKVGDGVVTVEDWRVPVCASHAEAFGVDMAGITPSSDSTT